MLPSLNKTVLMSGANYFDDAAAINPFMNAKVAIDRVKAQAEHAAIREALQTAGVKVIQVEPPQGCQDGVYTANWALVRGDKALLSTLPNARTGEEAYAEQVLRDLGKTTYKVPNNMHFSGQGDALACGPYLFTGAGYRTDPAAHRFIEDTLGYQVISLQTVPQTNWLGQPKINKSSGWPDSFFYDIDLALSIIKAPNGTEKGLIAWCPEAFVTDSQVKIASVDAVDAIQISLSEAKQAFACNLVSTGKIVIMSDRAPQFQAELESRGYKVVTPEISELAKGGGYIRCTTLTLD